MTLAELQDRRDAVIGRGLEIQVELTEMKRLWVVEKIVGDFGRRTTLEAECAALNVEKHLLNSAISKIKREGKRRTAALELAVQTRLLNERGLNEIIVEANRLADEACGVPT